MRGISISEYTVKSMADALAALGVPDGQLSAAEKAALEEDGYLVLTHMLDPEWLDALRHAYERLMNEKYGKWQPEMTVNRESDFWNNEAGTRRLADLVSEGAVFDGIYTHPRLLAAVAHILGSEFRLHSLNARDALPGQGHQGLHVDGAPLQAAEPFYLVNSAWLLDDFTVENGATRVVPGSHRIPGALSEHVRDLSAPHPQQRIVTAPAGSVFVCNAHVWHSGTRNQTRSPRRVIHCAYSKPACESRCRQDERIRKSTYARISAAARYLLDL